jgi:hypothetical protein
MPAEGHIDNIKIEIGTLKAKYKLKETEKGQGILSEGEGSGQLTSLY